jgi:hypothetical protein
MPPKNLFKIGRSEAFSVDTQGDEYTDNSAPTFASDTLQNLHLTPEKQLIVEELDARINRMPAVIELGRCMIAATEKNTKEHCDRVCTAGLSLAVDMGLPPEEAFIIGLGLKVHDVYRVENDDLRKLSKKRDSLTLIEREKQDIHPLGGALRACPYDELKEASGVILGHHRHSQRRSYPEWPLNPVLDERLDLATLRMTYEEAQAYTEWLAERDRNMTSREKLREEIAGVVDPADACLSVRWYRDEPYTLPQTIDNAREDFTGSQEVLDAFIRLTEPSNAARLSSPLVSELILG